MASKSHDDSVTVGDDPLDGPVTVPGPRVRCVLLVASGEGSRIVELHPERPISIGRDATADIAIDARKVSRRHARVLWSHRSVIVEDLGSRNGTLVNEVPLRSDSESLREGDRLRIGPATIMVSFVHAPPAASRRSNPGLGPPPGLVFTDPAMLEVLATAERLGATRTNVLVRGESGAGKDTVARMVHAFDADGGPLVRVHCSAPDESELARVLFPRGDEGPLRPGCTLVLEELGALASPLQLRLLGALPDDTTTSSPLAGIRIIATTHRDLESEAHAGTFSKELFYRIAVFTLEVPPLRTRPSEISRLAAHFVEALSRARDQRPPTLRPDALEALLGHDWPGNVRELRNAVQHALVVADDEIGAEHWPRTIAGTSSSNPRSDLGSLPGRLDALERGDIVAALRAEDGNRTRAAKRLGISRRALQYKLTKYDIDQQ